MSTIKQKLAFEEMIKAINTGKNLNWGQIMKNAGYKEKTSKKPIDLTGSKGFQTLLARIDDGTLLAKLYETALKQTGRTSTDAISLLLKVKDRMPANKSNINITESDQDEIIE